MTKFKKNTLSIYIYISLSLSLLVDLSMHFDFPERMCTYQSLSLSLSIYICKNGLDPDQTRMEFRRECFVYLKKMCSCAIESTQSVVRKPIRTIKWALSVYIVRSHARIQRGEFTGFTEILKTTKPAFNVGPSSACQGNAI